MANSRAYGKGRLMLRRLALCHILLQASLLATPAVVLSHQYASPVCEGIGATKAANEALVSACLAVLKKDSNNAEAVLTLGAALANLGRVDDALGVFRKYVMLRPEAFDGHYNLGLMLEVGEKYSKALPHFEQGLRHARSVAEQQTAAWHIGIAHYNLGHAMPALDWFTEAAALDSTDASAWSYAGIVAAQAGRHHEAMRYWARTLQADPNYLTKVQQGERNLYAHSFRRAGRQSPAPLVRHGLVPPLADAP